MHGRAKRAIAFVSLSLGLVALPGRTSLADETPARGAASWRFFERVERPALPRVEREEWIRNPIDR
ncbi:MAG TPA: hypothetical protein VK116_20215, partial [Planctomycetota bacterium]|nr:hypothetical protein [Planctomycetota bacterium]